MGFRVYVEEFRLTHTVVQDVQAYHASYALHDAHSQESENSAVTRRTVVARGHPGQSCLDASSNWCGVACRLS